MHKSDLPSTKVQETEHVQEGQKAAQNMQEKKQASGAADQESVFLGKFQKEDGNRGDRYTGKKRFLLICGLLTAVGFVLTIGGIGMGGLVTGVELSGRGFQVYAPSLEEDVQEIVTKKQLEPFDQVEVTLDYADVRMEVSDSGQYALSYCMDKDMNFQYEVTGGKLAIGQKRSLAVFSNHFSWFSFGGWNSGGKPTEVVVYVPEEADMEAVHIETETGDVSCGGFSIHDLTIAADYGNVEIKNTKTKKIEASLESGAMLLEQVDGENCEIASEYGGFTMKDVVLMGDMKLRMESGNAKCQNVRMRDFSLKNSYGNFDGENMAFRNAAGDMESGDCEVRAVSFDNWDMNLEYGNIRLQLAGELSEYGYELNTDYGNVKIDGKNMGESYYSLFEDKDKAIKINCESGDIILE